MAHDRSGALRSAMRRWPSGVTAVTTAHRGRRTGMTVSSFCCLTLEPPTVMVCLHKATETLRLATASGSFAVSVLNEKQVSVSRQLAAPPAPGEADRLAGIPCRTGKTGSPLIQRACSWIECRVLRAVRLSTHIVLIGKVVSCGAGRATPPLVYHDRDYRRLR